ncbi:hypothetical protein [Cerasicoccus arenae]|nr:hypothetical protein [Cerasicoccus arenae]MBK1858695.1 hypothetical protein [Cerasicoccus arenae]
MNLAPIKFRDILVADGGPIRTVDIGSEMFLGREHYSAHAYLRDDLRTRRTMHTIPDMPDGVGSGKDPSTAHFRAVSEALERWAFRHCSLDDRSHFEYGFDYDPTTNGMAAYPGLFDSAARMSARREAIERHCLILWWEGFLGITSIADPFEGVRAVRIDNPFSDDVVVLLWQFVDERFYTYGFGLGASVDKACWRAGIELSRTAGIVKTYYEFNNCPDRRTIEELDHPFERRILYFSRPEGFLDVIKKMESSPQHEPPQTPLVIVDRKLVGPWSKYATVWRVVIEQPSREFAGKNADYFFW